MTEEKTLYRKTAVGIAGLLGAPFVSYVMFEYVTGNLKNIPWHMALLNIFWMVLFYLIIFGVCGNSRITVGIASFILYGVSLAETFVVSFRSRPIIISEVLAFRTALSVAGSYEFRISRAMIIAAVILLGLNLALWFVPVHMKGWKKRFLNLACCSFFVYAGVGGFYKVIMPGMGIVVDLWSLNESYENNGFLLSSAVSLQYMVQDVPAGYSTAKLNEIYNESEVLLEERDERIGEDAVRPVNIVCIMNESLSELKAAGDYETNIPYFPFLDSLKENTVRGNLCVPVFGSLTSNTEYEFLTGDAMALLPANSIAYQFFVEPDTLSMVSTLKNQGYRTVAMHPYPGANWNRINCYRNMGFDEFWDEEQYEDSELLRLYVSDQADYDKIIELVEKKENPDDKLFVFNVTMQNHGGYDIPYDNFEQEVWLTGEYEGLYPKTDQYLSLMKKSDEAFEYLLDYFKDCGEPTMVVMFGDHQPDVEEEFYDSIFDVPVSEVKHEQRLMWYETPFVIWTNYDQPEEDLGTLGSIYLGAYVLDRANLEMTPYDVFRLNVSRELPVVHFLGCYDREGKFYGWPEVESGTPFFAEQLKKYEMLVYNHSLDGKEMRSLYSIR